MSGPTLDSSCITAGCLVESKRGLFNASLSAATSCSFCLAREVLCCNRDAISLLCSSQPKFAVNRRSQYFLFRSRLPSPYRHSALSSIHFSHLGPPVHLALSALHLSQACAVLLAEGGAVYRGPLSRGRISLCRPAGGAASWSEAGPECNLSGCSWPDMALTGFFRSLHGEPPSLPPSPLTLAPCPFCPLFFILSLLQ